jgi:NAD(P)-dependent dehydrogenase (short-subunit alcohol dehydrogenase family)
MTEPKPQTKCALYGNGGAAVDLKHRKIRVNTISPGPIYTPMTSGMVESGTGRAVEELPREYRAVGSNGKPRGSGECCLVPCIR